MGCRAALPIIFAGLFISLIHPAPALAEPAYRDDPEWRTAKQAWDKAKSAREEARKRVRQASAPNPFAWTPLGFGMVENARRAFREAQQAADRAEAAYEAADRRAWERHNARVQPPQPSPSPTPTPAPAAGAAGPQHPSPSPGASRSTPTINQYGRDLTALAAQGQLGEAFEREAEVSEVVRTLLLRRKSNPLLLGHPGVGKTAIVEGVALRIAQGKIPALRGCRLVELNMAALTAGTQFVGDFEERVQKVLKEAGEQDGKLILFIDEIHSIVGLGDQHNDASNMLKPALARGLRLIGATTVREYNESIGQNAALARRFGVVPVKEPDPLVTLGILKRVAPLLAKQHGVAFTKMALRAAVIKTLRHLPGEYFPDKAIGALDGAASLQRVRAAGEGPVVVTARDVSRWITRLAAGQARIRAARPAGELSR